MNDASTQQNRRKALTQAEIDEIVADLEAQRDAEGLSDEQFAIGRLDIDPSSWWRIRNGRQGLGLETRAGIDHMYPRIGRKVSRMLANKARPLKLRV